MAGRDTERDWDLDDWFAEPEFEAPRRRRRAERATAEPPLPQDGGGPAGADDWLARSDGARERYRGVQRSSRNARLALGAAVLAVLLLIGLAAGGVFSGGGKKAAPPAAPTTTPTATVTPSTGPATTPVRVPTSTLKLGDKGAQVTILQRALKSLGYAPGAIDGKYGPSTQRAVARFQRAAKLATDGIVGPKTLAALAQAARAKG
ncbi:MAG TPA: peptidoglycan-binding domain-containing protein [Gaiellaceae bacterium]|jgi:hypothetical protein|nr:peptidoglycan-binding domain-containing protein [Gaiellaceae bacterium]